MARRVAAVSALLASLAAVLAVVATSERGRPGPAPVLVPVAHASAPHAHRSRRHALPPAPAQVRGDGARRMAIPILMYHVIAAAGPGARYPSLWVRPSVFTAEMTALRRAGYHGITLAAAYRAWTHGAPLPRRPVVVSFDDGYLSDYTRARPVLRRLGWPGVLNLVIAQVRPGDLSASEVRALIRAGWEIDSHTVDHADLTVLGAARLRWELVASRRALRRRFGVPADFFCYPAGRYDATVVAAVAAAGYRAATTENEGYAGPGELFTLPRIGVRSTDTPTTLLARLAAQRPRV